MPVSMQCPTASELSYRVQGTLWEPGRLTALPCAMGAPELVSSMQAQLTVIFPLGSRFGTAAQLLLHVVSCHCCRALLLFS